MEKIIVWCLLSVALFAQTDSLENSCLACHKSEQIPSHMIYKKYLLKYSSKARIEAAMYKYLKNPKKSNSVMPPQFFLKFPMKPSLGFSEETLRKNIRIFIDAYDMKKKLVLPK